MADKINKNRHRLSRVFKRALALFIIVIINFNSFSAVVSSNDGSAFITKAEFDALVNDFNSRIEDYEKSIDAKIDGAIAEYLAGLATTATDTLINYFDNYSYNTKSFVGLSFLNKHTSNGNNMGKNCYFQGRIIGMNTANGSAQSDKYRGYIRFNIVRHSLGSFEWVGEENVGTFLTNKLTFGGVEYPYFSSEKLATQYNHSQYGAMDLINAGFGSSISVTPENMFNDSAWNDFKIDIQLNAPSGMQVDWSDIRKENTYYPWQTLSGVVLRYDSWDEISESGRYNINILGHPASGAVTTSNKIYWVDNEKVNDFSEKRAFNSSFASKYGINPGVAYTYESNDQVTVTNKTVSKAVNIKSWSLYGVKYNEEYQHDAVILYEPSIAVNQPIFQYNGIPVTRVTRMGTLEFTIRTPDSYTTDTRVILSNTPFDNQSLSATSNKKLLDVNTVISQDKPYKVKVDLSKIEGISYPFTLYVKAYNSNGFQVEIPDDITITSEA